MTAIAVLILVISAMGWLGCAIDRLRVEADRIRLDPDHSGDVLEGGKPSTGVTNRW